MPVNGRFTALRPGLARLCSLRVDPGLRVKLRLETENSRYDDDSHQIGGGAR